MNFIKTLQYSVSIILSLCCVTLSFAQTPGAQDTAFGSISLTPGGAALGFGVQPDGKVLVVTGTNGGFSASRYLSNGQPDATFGTGGTATVATFNRGGVAASHVLVDPLGRIYLHGGYFYIYASPDSSRTETGTAIARFLANGAVDTSFGDGGVIRNENYNETNPSSPSTPPITRVTGVPIALQQFGLLPDGKLLAAGTSKNSVDIARFSMNGQLDTSFGGAGYRSVDVGESFTITVMKISQDGAVFMLGRSTTNLDHVVMKLTAQGTLDTSFGNAGKVRIGNNASYWYFLSDLAVQPDGKILVSGSREPVPGSEVAYPNANPADSLLARLTADGELDASFGNGGLSEIALPDRDILHALALEPNGKILAAGITVAPDSTATDHPFLVRTLANGQVDTSFQRQTLSTAAQIADLEVGRAAYLLTVSNDGRQLQKFFIDPPARTGSLTTGSTPSASSFGVEMLNVSGMPVSSGTTAQQLGLHGYIYPQDADLAANADVFVVVSTARGWFMRTTSGAFIAWSGRVADLMPAYEDMQLTESTHVSIYGGALPFGGLYGIYVGYMRDGGPLIYIDEPVALQITE